MHSEPNKQESPRASIGCGLVLIGVVGGGFGIAALTGISDRVELEFFGIELNDALGRFLWTAGCVIALGIGARLLRSKGRKA